MRCRWLRCISCRARRTRRESVRPARLRSGPRWRMRFLRPLESGFESCPFGRKTWFRRMSMRTLWITLAGLAVAMTASPQQPAAAPAGGGRGAPQPQAIVQVKPGLYMITGAGGNTAVRVTNEGLIVMDGKLPGDANYNALMALIKTVSDKPVKFLIVTHHHADHTGNNAKFLEAGAQVVAHENLKTNLVTYEFNPKPAPPSITYPGKDYVVRLGGVAVELHHFGRAHTSGDTVVYFPDLKVVALSDTVTTGKTGPLIDYAGGGSAVEWTQVLDSVLKLDFDAA